MTSGTIDSGISCIAANATPSTAKAPISTGGAGRDRGGSGQQRTASSRIGIDPFSFSSFTSRLTVRTPT
jgi:hypothetical protein